MFIQMFFQLYKQFVHILIVKCVVGITGYNYRNFLERHQKITQFSLFLSIYDLLPAEFKSDLHIRLSEPGTVNIYNKPQYESGKDIYLSL